MNEPATNIDLPTDGRSDSILLDLVKHGEQDAATELYHRYANRLIRLVGKRSHERLSSRVDAEDIVQSVFRTFFRRASIGHYVLPDGEELWKLFLVISLNKIRKKVRHHAASKRDIGRTHTIGQREIAATNESDVVLRMTIDELVSDLPLEHQAVIRDRIQGFEVSEMAVRNRLSKRTIERLLQSFRRRLKQHLETSDDEHQSQ